MKNSEIYDNIIPVDVADNMNDLIKQAREELKQSETLQAYKTAIIIQKLAEQHNDAFGMGYYYLITGACHVEDDQFDLGIEAFLQGLHFAEQIGNRKLKAALYNQIGKSYAFLDDLEKAYSNLERAILLDNNNYELLNTMGMICFHRNKNEEALLYFSNALAIVQENRNRFEEVRILMNIGRNYVNNNSELALENYNKALKIVDENEYLNFKITLLMFISKVNMIQDNYELAEKNCLTSYNLSKELKEDDSKGNCCYYLYNIYKTKGDLDKGMKFLEEYIATKESLFNKEMGEKISHLQSKYNQEKTELQKQNNIIKKKFKVLKSAYTEVTGIGKIGIFSARMREIKKMAEFLQSNRSTPVLIEGETGTGKEIIARMVHFSEEDLGKAFITLNCSAISENLFESELFGYENGAFTGARKGGKPGKLELANGGTLFLDEIGDMPLELQPKLLRVLQEKEFYRVGGSRTIKVDVRIICATNRNLKEEMDRKRFRPDLYFRLNTGRIFVPALRDRKEEIVPLAELFLHKFAAQKKKSFRYLDDSAVKLLKQYNWPGNVRELQNAVERVVLMHDDVEASSFHFSFLLREESTLKDKVQARKISINLPEGGKSLFDIEREMFNLLLNKFQGNQTKLAQYLDVSRYTIIRKKKKFEL